MVCSYIFLTKSEMFNLSFANVVSFAVCVLHWWHCVSDIDFEWFYHTIFVAPAWNGQAVSNEG